MSNNSNIILGRSQQVDTFTLKLTVVENGIALKPLKAKATGDKDNLTDLLTTLTTALRSLSEEGGIKLPEPAESKDNAKFHSGN